MYRVKNEYRLFTIVRYNYGYYNIHVDASYLSRSHAHANSIAGAIFFLGNHFQPTRINGTIHAMSSTIPCVVASAAEAEYTAIFAGAQHGAYLSTVLTDLGYPQDPIIIMADNTKRSNRNCHRLHQTEGLQSQSRWHEIPLGSRSNTSDVRDNSLSLTTSIPTKTWPITSRKTSTRNDINSSPHSASILFLSLHHHNP